MSQFSRDPRGARDFSSPQVRVRGAGDFRHYSSQRLRLPNERPPLGPPLRRLFGALLALAVAGGIGVGVYFGVAALLNEDDPPAAAADTTEPEPAQSRQAAEPATQTQPAQPAPQPAASQDAEAGEQTAPAPQPAQETPSEAATQDAPQDDTAQEAAPPVAVSTLAPSVAEQPVTPAQIDGSAIIAERATAEPIPSGIPRTLADSADYDPTEPATVFTSLWPVGTTLRLTRLPGATLLTDEQQQQVIGSQALVVVRATESSNTDLQMSPAAFERIAFYGVERVIAVRVEVTAPPP